MSIPVVVEMQRIFARTEELCSPSIETTVDTQSELRDIFRRTRDLAIELMRDNEQLRVQNMLLEKQKNEAEQRLDSTRMGKENEQLRSEIELFQRQTLEMEKKANKYKRRYDEIEQMYMALMNIHVASTQLHSTLDFSIVVRTAGEILWNLVAASVFGIFLFEEKTGALKLVGGEGVEGRFPGDSLHVTEGMIAESLNEGVSLFIDGETKADPLACVPLKVEGRGVIGMICVYEVEEHKDGLSDLDKELFDMLANQTATAMTSSKVYSETLKKLKSMESFISLVRPE
jgi:hypothetical protein